MELLYAKNKLVKQIAKIENKLMDKFVQPSLLFLLSDASDNDIKNVIGILLMISFMKLIYMKRDYTNI